jgi:hypothetical protein
MRIGSSALAALLVLPFATDHASADEGRIPLYIPAVISQPGKYVVTRDISGANPIVIQSSGVVLDLDGHTITGTAPANPVIAVAQGATDITIRNGSLVGGSNSVFVESTAMIPARLLVERVMIRGHGGHGIMVIGPPERVDVERCWIEGGNSGVVITNAVASVSGFGRIVDTTIQGVSNTGILMFSPLASEIRGNTVRVFGGQGGIVVTSPALIEGNIVRGGNLITAKGIMITGTGRGSVVRRNHVNANLGTGIEVSNNTAPYTLVDDNQVTDNGGCGLSFQPIGCAYRNNLLRNNTAGAVCGNPATDAGGNIL